MKVFSALKRAPKRIAMAAAVLTSLVALPIHSMAAGQATIEGSIGVANQTRGEQSYKPSTNASYNEVVRFSVYYHNRELPDSGRVAENLKINVDFPTTAGTTQVVKTTISGTNTNTVTDSATVNLDRADAKIEFIPGSVVWKHNTGSRTAPNIVTEKIADKYIDGTTVLENEQPCFEYEATVTFDARVIVPSVGIQKFVRKAGTKDQATTNLAVLPGERVEYAVVAKNLSNTPLTNVYLRDPMPNGLKFVSGTTKKYYGTYNGTVMTADEEAAFYTGKKNIGTLMPGATATITFEATVAQVEQLACGANKIVNTAVVDTDQTGDYNNTATVTTTKTCAETPTYSCDLFKAVAGANRTVTVTDFMQSAANGATFKDVVIDWNDGSTALTTTAPVNQKHQYAKDGEYNIRATARFTVNGQTVENTSASCVAKVTFSSTPVTVVTTTPTALPNTGPGNVAAVFALITVAGAVAHRLVLARRF